MAYAISFTKSAARDLRALDEKTQHRLAKAIDALASEPRPMGVQKLSGTKKGEEPLYRIRVGDYRIVYQISDRIVLVTVVRIGHRGGVYR